MRSSALAQTRRDPLAGQLRLALLPTIGPYLLPLVALKMRKALPRLELMLYEYQTEPMLERLHNGDIDVGILALPVQVEGLVTRELYEEPFVAALPAGHPLAARARRCAPRTSRARRCCCWRTGIACAIRRWRSAAAAACSEKQDFRATSIETLRQMVAAGAGVTLLPALAERGAYGAAKGLAVRPFAKPVPSRQHRRGLAQEQRPRARRLRRSAIRSRATADWPRTTSAHEPSRRSLGLRPHVLAGGRARTRAGAAAPTAASCAAYLGTARILDCCSALARQAARGPAPRRRDAAALKVYLLPGILGSQLGRLRAAGEPPDLLWLDPGDIVNGRLTELRIARAPARRGAVAATAGRHRLQLSGAEAAPGGRRLRGRAVRL